MAQREIPAAVRESRVRTSAEWHALGVGESEIRALAKTGDLVQQRRGVYATRKAVEFAGKNPRRLHALNASAVLAVVGGDAVISHHSAARILGLDMLDPPPADIVTVTRQPPRHSRNRKADGVVFHRAQIPDSHRVRVYGLPLTSAGRTVIDIARTSSFRAGVVIADSAVRLDQTSRPELAVVVKACMRWPGVEQARKVIEFCDGSAESVLESCARVVFAEHGLEPPELQAGIYVEDQQRFWVDFYWRRHQTIAEVDGLGKLSTPNDIRKQFDRDRLLRRAGYGVVHFTWREILAAPEAVVRNIRDTFAAAARLYAVVLSHQPHPLASRVARCPVSPT